MFGVLVYKYSIYDSDIVTVTLTTITDHRERDDALSDQRHIQLIQLH